MSIINLQNLNLPIIMNILGIDIGTTSVKIVVHDFINKVNSATLTRDTNSNIISANVHHHEQDVDKIFQTINNLLYEIDPKLLLTVGHIGISGQMHGVMFWNDRENLLCKHSNFITWMDQRCTNNNFIDVLPKMPSNLVEDMPISTGYGCGTIFHLMESDPKFIEGWKYAGNIVDFFANTLCGLDCPVMSPQTAHSWGYFDIVNNRWFTQILEENKFPTRLLPNIAPPGTVIGGCKGFSKIPAKALVYVGMGDLQCSMYGALSTNLNAAINMSTSAQFAVRVTLSDLENLSESTDKMMKLPPGLVINPYFDDGDYLLVAASLNGGNVLEAFVSMLQQWVCALSGMEIPKEKIWSHLTSSYRSDITERSDDAVPASLEYVTINPTLFGERYCPTSGASISDLFPYNCSLDNIYSSTCYGLVKNLTNLLPLEIVSRLPVSHLRCSGGAIKRNKCLEDCIGKVYHSVSDIEFTKEYDACVGAVEYLHKMIKEQK